MSADPTPAILQAGTVAPERGKSAPKPPLSAVPKGPKPPPHLSAASRKWWSEVVSTWVLESHHLRVLTAVCVALDRAEDARKEIKTRGLLVLSPTGELKPNPAVGIERNSMTLVYRGIRELDLDVEPPPTTPRVRGRR